MSLFLIDNYRDVIKERLKALPKEGRGEISKMAQAIGVHQTLMSLVLSGERDLSIEQGYDLAQYFGYTQLECEYFSLLIQKERAGNVRYKDFVSQKIEQLKKEASKIAKRVDQNKMLSDHERAIMYSSWIYSAVRMFTSISDGGQTIENIQKKFHLSRQQVQDILNFLTSAGLVEQIKNAYVMCPQKTFLEHGSPHLLKHHSNWRIKALSKSDLISEKEMMFTSPVSISKKDFEHLREKLVLFIKDFLETVKNSDAEDIACLNIDFFWID